MAEIKLSDIKIRTFGWVQNPSNFKKLKKVVQIFDNTSSVHENLKNKRIIELVEVRDGRNEFIRELNKKPLELKYSHLVGSSFTPRSSARCNGIIQATVKGQGSKQFIDDWSSDGFLRWAHALGFIEYLYESDSFRITTSGFDFSRTKSESKEEKKVLIDAMLSYPPAVRVLGLLAEGDHLTKFEIGKKLGFNGESGFTSLPQNILLDTLAKCEDNKEKSKIRGDWDGSADKYARMISGWLRKLGLVSMLKKEFDVRLNGLTQVEYIGHAYKITHEGLKELRRAKGINKVRRIKKNVCWEMFSTKVLDRVYLRTRRSYILKILEKANSLISIESIHEALAKKGIQENLETIRADIEGLINIGLNIDSSSNGYILYDTINNFLVPVVRTEEAIRSNLEELKSELRSELKHISHDYLELIEISQDAKQNRLFEMKVMDLFVSEYGYKGSHLGGSRKPDGAIFTDSLKPNYGVIVDTKAYKSGYSLPISQADEMERYIRENISRSKDINPNEWWDVFPEKIVDFKYLFVSSYFKGNFKEQLKRINLTTHVKGGAINVEHLLLGAEYVKRGVLSLDKFGSEFDDDEITL